MAVIRPIIASDRFQRHPVLQRAFDPEVGEHRLLAEHVVVGLAVGLSILGIPTELDVFRSLHLTVGLYELRLAPWVARIPARRRRPLRNLLGGVEGK